MINCSELYRERGEIEKNDEFMIFTLISSAIYPDETYTRRVQFYYSISLQFNMILLLELSNP